MTTFRGRPPSRIGGQEFAGPAPEQHYYRTGDGWLAVSARTDTQRRTFHDLKWLPPTAMHQPEPSQATLAALMAASSTTDLVDSLAAADVPAAEVLRRPNAVASSYLAANGVTTVLDVPDLGRFLVARSYSEWRGEEAPAGRAGRIGSDTVEVLREAGIEPEQVADLIERKVARADIEATGS
jgi:crotonobetainyl-CoA:carnitine CoA-transferase CaiB-like acyl-CoA transferase